MIVPGSFLKHDGERIGAGHAVQHRQHGGPRLKSLAQVLRQQMRDDFGVGLALEHRTHRR